MGTRTHVANGKSFDDTLRAFAHLLYIIYCDATVIQRRADRTSNLSHSSPSRRVKGQILNSKFIIDRSSSL